MFCNHKNYVGGPLNQTAINTDDWKTRWWQVLEGHLYSKRLRAETGVLEDGTYAIYHLGEFAEAQPENNFELLYQRQPIHRDDVLKQIIDNATMQIQEKITPQSMVLLEIRVPFEDGSGASRYIQAIHRSSSPQDLEAFLRFCPNPVFDKQHTDYSSFS